MNKFKSQFKKFLKKNLVTEEETKEGVEELKYRVEKIEDMFQQVLGTVQKISKDLDAIKKRPE